jgi:hypothetical protein
VIKIFRDFFSDTVNFVHRQVLQISALHIFLREVLFAYGSVVLWVAKDETSVDIMRRRLCCVIDILCRDNKAEGL